MVYLTTIPVTQWSFLRGQNTYMRQRGFELHAVSSPGPLLEELRVATESSSTQSPFRGRLRPCATW